MARPLLNPLGMNKRIVWLAAADARGHLMRSHVVREQLAHHGIDVDVVTTSREGVAFLEAQGTPARLLSDDYAVAFDEWQNLDRARTDGCIARYLFGSPRGLRDLGWLEELARGAEFIVNDFHPLLLVAPMVTERERMRIVHVYGENLWGAIEGNMRGRLPRRMEQAFRSGMRGMRDRAWARIEHTLAPDGDEPRALGQYRVRPIIAAPTRSRAAVRSAVRAGDRPLAAVYLNPHFRDPALAAAIEGALDRMGFAMHAVGEGFADRPGWRAFDGAFADVVAAADLLVSAAGMAALTQSLSFGTPFLVLQTDQPEQVSNVDFLRRRTGARFDVVRLSGAPADLEERLHTAAAGLVRAASGDARPDASEAARRVQQQWVRALTKLTARAEDERRQTRSKPHNAARSLMSNGGTNRKKETTIMKRTSHTPSAALVIETNNLRGEADAANVTATLANLLRHLNAQTRALSTLSEVVVTHDGLPEASQRELAAVANRAIRFVRLAEGTGYYQAKNIGFDATTAEVIVFGDSDCWPDDAWLDEMLAPFDDLSVQVVAGRTTYEDSAFGQAMTAVDFMYFPSPLAPQSTRNFYAGNVAFRRDAFARRRFVPAPRMFRGHCQMMGLRLHADGVAIRFAPLAHITHASPEDARALAKKRLLRGSDAAVLAPHLIRTHVPSLGRVADAAPFAALAMMTGRFVCSLQALGAESTSGLTVMQRMSRVAAVVAISALDTAGTLAHGSIVARFGVRNGGLESEDGLPSNRPATVVLVTPPHTAAA